MAFRAAADGRAGAMLAMSSAVMIQNRATMATLARQLRLPSMAMDRAYVEAGTLASYGANLAELHRTAATWTRSWTGRPRPTCRSSTPRSSTSSSSSRRPRRSS